MHMRQVSGRVCCKHGRMALLGNSVKAKSRLGMGAAFLLMNCPEKNGGRSSTRSTVGAHRISPAGEVAVKLSPCFNWNMQSSMYNACCACGPVGLSTDQCRNTCANSIGLCRKMQ